MSTIEISTPKLLLNHRRVQVGSDLGRSSGPTISEKGALLRLSGSLSNCVLKISRHEDSAVFLGRLFQ